MGGGAGADQVFGADGNDTLGSGDFVLGTVLDDTGLEADLVDGGAGDDYVAIGVNDTAHGGDGTDTLKLTFAASTTGLTFTFSPAAMVLANGAQFDGFERLEFHGGTGIDKVTGGALDDLLYGGAGADTLTGGEGSDWLTGDNGNDILHGGNGNDGFSTDLGNDKLLGEAGDDVFQVQFDNFGVDSVNGGAGTDTVAFYSLDVSAEIDLQAQALNDGVAKNDTFTAIERFQGTILDDTFRGDAAANRFEGSLGDDRLDGRNGDDYLAGGAGADILTGGAGKDTFEFGFDTEFSTSQTWRADVITDFVAGQDKIALWSLDFGFDATHPFQLLVGIDPQANAPGPVMLFETGTGRLWHDADGNSPVLDRTLVATLNGVTNLAATDFVLQ
jgi:Ca2+-binding RTX toxin-like protein